MESKHQQFPDSLIDPITYEPFADPVIASDGHTYERSSIVGWFEQCRQQGQSLTSPLTRTPMTDILHDNIVVRQLVAELHQRLLETKPATDLMPTGDVDPPGMVIPQDAGTVTSLAALAEAFEAVDPIRGVLDKVLWQPPQIVVLGNENSGKSTLLERIAMMPLFPIDKRICTRMAIKICLRRGEPQPPLLEVREMHNNVIVRCKHIAIDAAAGCIEEWMREEVQRENGGVLSGVCRSRMLVIHIKSSIVPNLDLVDLPGLVATHVQGEPADMGAQTRRLVENYLDRHTQHSLFLVTVPANGGANQSIAMDIVQQRNLKTCTIGVLTKADLLVYRDADDDDGEADVQSRLEELKSKLDQCSPDIVPVHPHGYVATMNKPPRPNQRLSCRHDDLRRQAERELRWFQSRGFDNDGRVSVTAVVARLMSMYHAYLTTTWLPGAIAVIKTEVAMLENCERKLGLPRAHDVTLINPTELVATTRATFTKQLGNCMLTTICTRVHGEVLHNGILFKNARTTQQVWQLESWLQSRCDMYDAVASTYIAQCAQLCQAHMRAIFAKDSSDFRFGRFHRVLREIDDCLQRQLDGWQAETREAVSKMIQDYHNNISSPDFKMTHSFSNNAAVVACEINYSRLNVAVCQTVMQGVCKCLLDLDLQEMVPHEPEMWLESCTEERIDIMARLSEGQTAISDLAALLERGEEILQSCQQQNIQVNQRIVLVFRFSVSGWRQVAPIVISPELIMEHTKGVMSNDPALQFSSTKHFHRVLSIERNAHIQQVIDAGVVPRFVQFLQRDDLPQLQFEASWVLTNIASGTTDHTRVVIEANAVPLFVQLLSSPNEDVREQAAWALGNVAVDSTQSRDVVLQYGALPALLQSFTDQARQSTIRNATWTLSNLCRGKPAPDLNILRPALPYLARLMMSNDAETVTDACWALSYISDGPNDRIQAVLDTGVASQLVQLLSQSNTSVQTPALRTVGNIVTGNDQQAQQIINLGALGSLMWMLEHPKENIRKEACWAISNITAGTAEQIQAVIDAGIFPRLIHLLIRAEFDIRKEAAWAISNATSRGRPEQIVYIVNQNAIQPLCDLLSVDDSKIVTIALEGLENILKVGQITANQHGIVNPYATAVHENGGTLKIKQLHNHQEQSVYEKAQRIFQNYGRFCF